MSLSVVMLSISDLITTVYSIGLMLERGLCLSISVQWTLGQVELIATNIAVGHLFEVISGAPLGSSIGMPSMLFVFRHL